MLLHTRKLRDEMLVKRMLNPRRLISKNVIPFFQLVAVLALVIIVHLLADSVPGGKNMRRETHDADARTENGPHQEKKKNEEKTILIWSPYGRWNKQDWARLFSRQIAGQCPHKCKIVYGRGRMESADAIVFYDVGRYPLPKTHPPEQVWVLFNMEASTHSTWAFPQESKGVFDWTMTYHRESDVVTPYGVVRKRDQETKDSGEHADRDYWAEKREEKFASWMVSKCVTPSKREDFVSEFQRHENVDIYGGCGPLKCGQRTILHNLKKEKAQSDCYKLMNSYMFYFAFENSLCEDYITEKFFKALQMDAIPVVFGGGNYSAVAPNHSFINARDFESPKALASYLRAVANNSTLFNSYFKWKRDYVVESGFPFSPFVCDLCSKLHLAPTEFSKDRNSAKRTEDGRYADVIKWFSTVSKCEGGNNTSTYL
ncbi:alpha-(1,3)-fucosyltransferase C-like isoform X2 [Macrobrachium rosenbergii]|uniref:alpha-(1,3)-fucosyltransferase C-like isoform X2 n=1 Tax=Macrobrachium rosenbergii TaxID=79674 RepID=UPI0034D4080C